MSKEIFTVYLDNQAALKTLSNAYHEQLLVTSTQNLIKRVKKRVAFKWVEAYVGTEGNEEADRASKEEITLPKTSVGTLLELC